MRDVSSKPPTLRTAVAAARLRAAAATVAAVREGRAPKGDPRPVAQVAAIQAAKDTARLIPYCHPVPLDFVGAEFALQPDAIDIRCTVKAVWKTGVEMEALAGASAAALTLYDMLKPIDDAMVIESIRLEEKRGGRSEHRAPAGRALRAAVLVISDSTAAGTRIDSSGKLIAERLREIGADIAPPVVVPDERARIAGALRRMADEAKVDLVLTTGGTGLGSRDVTPEAMEDVIEREAPGLAEAARAHGQTRTPLAMLSRGRAGVRGKTLIVNLPGSKQAVEESLDALLPGLLHAVRMIAGEGHD
jgi:cyclic pyranopterin monophosphate synthase